MAIELITCAACGAKNASSRTVCLSCGADLTPSKEAQSENSDDIIKPVRQPLIQRVRQFAESFTIEKGIKLGIAVLFVVGLYLSFAWFFFGSAHPCGILEARMRSYYVELESELGLARYLDVLRFNQTIAPKLDSEAGRILDQFLDRSTREREAFTYWQDADKRAVETVRERISLYTPAECLWEVVWWRPNRSALEWADEQLRILTKRD